MTDDDLEQLMQDTFADACPREGMEDRIIARLRQIGLPRLNIHPLVRRAAVGVAAAILLGGVGFAVTREGDSAANRVKGVSNLRQMGQSVAIDANKNKDQLSRARSTETPRQAAQDLFNRLDWHFGNFDDDGDSKARRGAEGRSSGPEALARPWDQMDQAQSPSDDLAKELSKNAPESEKSERPVDGPKMTPSGKDASAARDAKPAQNDLSFYRFAAGEESHRSAGSSVVTDGSTSGIDGIGTTDEVSGRLDAGVSALKLGDSLGLDAGGKKFRPSDMSEPAKQLNNRAEQISAALPVEVQRKSPSARGVTVLGRATLESKSEANEPAGPASDAAAKPASGPPLASAQAPAPARPPTTPAPAPNDQAPVTRKIIRNGEMTFEVDGYDSAVMQVTKIAAEEGGFVSTTESEKLANGKVKGSVVVRCPPERLDTLVLKLRGLGDLKSSRIAAQDITKMYTDLDAQLRAARTMEQRLLEIVKNGKGTVKELVEAEKQLGTWREKIEKLEGEIRYYNNLVSLSTLTLTLAERDVRAAALLSESEQVNMGLEAENVEEARQKALAAIQGAKGRIVASDLKKHDAGQYAATITAEIAPDAAGPVVDQLKQLGRVARLEVERRQSTAEGSGAPIPGAKVERKDTRLMLSIYNLANVAARNTTTLNLASDDVEKTYRAILAQVEKAGGRVVNSQLTKPTPEQTTAVAVFEAPSGAADVLLDAVRGAGEVMRLDSAINPDTQNTTDAKRGFNVQIRSLATVPPREVTTLRVAASGVSDAFNKLREAVRSANGRILTSQLAEQDRNNVTGQLDFEVKRDGLAAMDAALAAAGVALSRDVNRSADTQNTVDSKVLIRVALADERTVPARESISLNLAVDDVASRYERLLDALRDANARIVDSQINAQNASNASASIAFDVRREHRAAVEKVLSDAGGVFGRTVARPSAGPAMLDDKVRIVVKISDLDNLAPRESTTIGIETRDVAKAVGDLEAKAVALGGRKVQGEWGQQSNGQTIARVVVDVPLSRAGDLIAAARDEGVVLSLQRELAPGAPEGPVARARLIATVATADPIVQGQGFGGSIRAGLQTSMQWLLRSVSWIVVGVCLVAPWALILWLIWKVIRRRRATASADAPPAVTA